MDSRRLRSTGLLLAAALGCSGADTRLARQTLPASTGADEPSQTASAAVEAVRGAAASEATDPQLPSDYLTVLGMLRDDDSVIPARPAVHPLHTVYNREAVVPPMCYTRTEGKHNPCYVCHQDRLGSRPNRMDDGILQREYSFSELGRVNHWRNLFEDRTARIAEISDEAIRAWIQEDNYSALATRLEAVSFQAYIPDLKDLQAGAAAFDDEGFARDGSNWVAFNYKPLPSTFWPTNGSTDDVMIRLPEAFRTTADGRYSRDVYKANLAIVEADIKDLTSIGVRAIDERAVGADLNGDGQLSVVDRITATADYVGAARGAFKRRHLYPQHTEFLHSVRYVGVASDGSVFVPPRMKELRYMRKYFRRAESQLYQSYLEERDEKSAGVLPGYIDRGQHGLDNDLGWVLLSFIENRKGQLRVANYEEHLYCMGCHTSIGATIDSTFSFARKVDGADGWGYVDLHGMPDAPSMGEADGEIATYLSRVGGGSEFRNNPEMLARFFRNGAVDPRKLAGKDVYALLTPSPRRALDLNKAYRTIVEDQDFVYGRDATVAPPENVYERVDAETALTLPETLTYPWDIRLDWSRAKFKASRPARPEISRVDTQLRKPKGTLP